MLATKILVALAAASVASAQMSACVEACAGASAEANNCTAINDFPCVCGNPQFGADAQKCVADNCDGGADIAVAQQFFRAACAVASVTPTGTAGPPKTLEIDIPKTSSPPASTTTTIPPASSSTASGGSNNGNGAVPSVAGVEGWTVAAIVMTALGAAAL